MALVRACISRHNAAMPQHNHESHATPHFYPLRQRLLAMAAMVQAAHLVQGIARKGQADAMEIETCVSSIFSSPGKTPEQMYGGVRKLRTGLILFSRFLQGEGVGKDIREAKELTAYTAAMIALEVINFKHVFIFHNLYSSFK